MTEFYQGLKQRRGKIIVPPKQTDWFVTQNNNGNVFAFVVKKQSG